MAGFNPSVLHVPQPLLDLCSAYKPDEDDYIRNRFFPRRPVAHKSDLIRAISKEATLRLYDQDWTTPNALAPSVSYEIGANLQYTCSPVSYRAPINADETANADAALQHELRQTRQALTSMGVRMEFLAVNSKLRSTAVMTNYVTNTAGSFWDDTGSTTSDPLGQLQDLISGVRIWAGRSNRKKTQGSVKIAMHELVFLALKQHPNVIDRVRFQTGSTGAILTEQILASILGLSSADDLIITSAHYATNQQGETAAYKSFIGSDVIGAYTDDGGLDDWSLGHEFAFNGMGGDDPFFVRKYRVEQEGIAGMDYVQVATQVDYKVIQPKSGFLIKNAVNPANTTKFGTWLD